jgi:DNA-binding response OmpR family regulator
MVQTGKIRLDQILQQEGLVTDAQINEALLRQKMQGGKFGSQLLYHRYIDEAGLVKALCIQFGCEGVILSNLEIPENIIKLVPSKLAITRQLMPFDYDPKTATIKIACPDPSDQNLMNELNFVSQGKKIKLYVAAELALETAINKHYLGLDAELNDKLLIEIPDLSVEPETKTAKRLEENIGSRKNVLLVTDEEYSGSMLCSILERDGYEVNVTESLSEAEELVTKRSFQAVFIKESLDEAVGKLVDKLRRNSPRTEVRVFESAASLLLNDESVGAAEEIIKKNLDLFISLLSSKDNLSDNHSATVGHYVDKLCRKLGLPARDRLSIIAAAYMHDLAKYYIHDSKDDYRQIISSTRQLLESFGYSPQVTGMLGLMYQDLKLDQSAVLPLEVLGSNIITIVDLFCQNIPLDRDFTLEKFDAIKKRLRDFSGKLFIGEVVEAFIGMIQEEILNLQTIGYMGQIALFANEARLAYPLTLRLKNEGFRVAWESAPDKYAEICRQNNPDLMIFIMTGEPDSVINTVNNIAQSGIDFTAHPTILLADSTAVARLASLFEKGIEDVMAAELNYELLIVKIRKMQSRLEERAGRMISDDKITGARGRLADMNIIDLMQALSPGRRTVRISVSPENAGDKLVIYLNKGVISGAELGNLKGADAVYEGMTWTSGTWVVEPVNPESLPESNNTVSNDSILMEGAYRLDEKMRAGKL